MGKLTEGSKVRCACMCVQWGTMKSPLDSRDRQVMLVVSLYRQVTLVILLKMEDLK